MPPTLTTAYRLTIIRSVIAVIVICCICAVARWVWITPIDVVLSKNGIGRLNLAQSDAMVQAEFMPRSWLCAISLLLFKPIQGSEDPSRHLEFPLSLRVRVSDSNSNTIIDEFVGCDRMQWTNWHECPSIALNLHSSLGEMLSRNREYVLTVSVNSAVPELGQAEVFLHWVDARYIWGKQIQSVRIISGEAK